MEQKRIYNFDEFFLALYQVPIIKREPPAFLIELRLKLSIVFASGLFIQMLSFLSTILKYYFHDLDLKLNELSECLAVFVGIWIVIYREFTFIMKKTRIRNFLKTLEVIFPKNYKDQQTYRLDNYAKEIMGKNKTIRLAILNATLFILLIPICKSIFFWVVSEDNNYQFLYPFVVWNPFGTSSYLGYAVVYCFQAATIFGGSYSWLKEDIIIATSTAQLCMHYRYLGEELSKLDARQGERTNRQLARLVRFQYNLDSICNEMNEIYSFSNFMTFAFTNICGCMFLFSLANSNDLFKTPVFVVDIFALMMSVYLRCSMGIKLFDASSNLLYSIYDHNWYEGTPKYRKMVLIMMIKANRPQTLQAFKMKTVSMEYFKEIIVSTYEIFMFLYNVTK
ncbi:odorant receptor 85c-like [Eupeodes corollae]|uniref:odorant receptor 85c-like n=1 Tax=Eupeodes corollae TaxID=290404 RepID=UPI00248F7487|nr:odorant receptor 85c-like [Eupeodes corollae]